MKTLPLFALALGALAAHPASAIEIIGSSVELKYQKIEDLAFEQYVLKGAIELGFGNNFSTQLDVSAYNSQGGSTGTHTNFGLHAIYRFSDTFALGAYVGRENLDFGPSFDNYGVEVAYSLQKVDIQAYAGRASTTGVDINIFGASVDYRINDHWKIGLSARAVRDAVEFERYALTTSYQLANGAEFFAEVGQFQSTGSNNTIVVGVRYGFGKNKGTTFDQRGYLASF